MSETPLRGVVVGHGALAHGLISAVRRIAGTEEHVLVGLSNEGLGPDGIRDRVDEILEGGPGVVFADLREGSCGLAARRCCKGRADRLLITGVNLPMLLDFVMQRHRPIPELAERLVQRGQTAVASFQEAD
jgi:mannose/fructose-specific phosphotransferase system component IIA